MKKQTPKSSPLSNSERRKRRGEYALIVGVALLFTALTWFIFKIFEMSEQLPIQHSIFFFGLINFNIILFLILIFFIFRNVVKQFAEREGGPIGSSLKSKLIAAFVGFSFVPTALMFLVSVFYINNSFDRWFNEKISGVLKSSIEVTNSYYLNSKKRNYHFASEVAKKLDALKSTKNMPEILSQMREEFSLDALEYYPNLFDEKVAVYAKNDGVPELPSVSLEFKEKAIRDNENSSIIHHYADGDIVRVIMPVKAGGAVVVSSYIPISLVARMDDIASTFENFRDADPLAYPLKSIYLVILVLMTLVILLCATWFGFFLARQLSVPLEKLDLATQDVVHGEFKQVNILSGSPEINRLIANFNTMTAYLEKSEKEVQAANKNLRKTLSQLDEHSHYIEVVLSNVTTGVISVNRDGNVTMINQHAERLLRLNPEMAINKRVQEVLGPEYEGLFSELLESMRSYQAQNLRKEIQITVGGKPLLLSMTISVLTGESGEELGKVLVFDDLTPVLAAQRAAAWTEVARRMAHEIKNPLTPISLAAQRLQRKFGNQIKDEAFSDCTKMIVDQVDGLKMLVNEFSQFARLPKSNPTLNDLNHVISNALQLFSQLDQSYSIQFQHDPKLPNFYFDSEQIRRVITNLVDNAVEGVKAISGAKIDVQTQFDPLSNIVRISVADNGQGISPLIRARIFEPYVTTKAQGTGLGLAIVKRTVEDHNGYVRVLENAPRGTRFVIELPVNMTNTSKHGSQTIEGESDLV